MSPADGDRRPRVPPHSTQAEEAVLGALLLPQAGQRAWLEVCDWLTADHFYRRDHQLVYRAIAELAGKEQPHDAVTVGEWFESMGQAEQVAGGAYLVELARATPSTANIVAYAEIVVGNSHQRQLVEVGTELVETGFHPDGREIPEVIQSTQHRLTLLLPTRRTGPTPVKAALRALYEDLQRRYDGQQLPGLPTPWSALNEATHGLQDGEVVLIAARSNMGKSVIGFQLSAFNALRGQRTLRFSLEMTAQQAARRDVAALGDIPHSWLLNPADGYGDYWDRLTATYRALQEAPLAMDDTPRLGATQISARAQREHLRAPVRLVLVDHLHEMKLPGRQGEVIERADALRDLKALAKHLGCPVVVLAQLNRGAAGSDRAESRRPRLTDLRGSGGIEEVADVVLFLHRPDYYNPADMSGVIEVTIGKGRDIPTGKTIYLRNRFDVMRADNWEGPLPASAASQPIRGGFAN
jgi:replicative DNA helicase